MLALIDLLKLENISLGDYKIHLATEQDTSPLDAYYAGHFKEWQEYQNKKNFECENVLSLIHLGGDEWLFAGVYEILSVRKDKIAPYMYETILFPGQDELVGRIVVQFVRDFRQSYIWGHKYGHALLVSEIKSKPISIEEFPGYAIVRVSHKKLRVIMDVQESSWKAALSNVKGIYLIADTATGKLYVGAAKGESGIWGRWAEYVQNGHGGNVQLEQLIDSQGVEYAENYQYAILEIADLQLSEETIENRESHWKEILLSREFGYNGN